MTNKQKFRATSFLLIIFLFLFCPDITNAQTGETTGFDNDDEIQKLLDENKIPALGIGVIRGGKLTQVKVIW